MLIFSPDLDVIVPYIDVKFEIQAVFEQLFKFSSEVREQIEVLFGDIVELPIVYDHSELLPILLWNKEDRGNE